MWQHHFEFLLLGYGAYATFAELCKTNLPDIPDQHIAQMVAGIDVLLFRPDAELRRLAQLAVDSGVDGAFVEGRTPEEIDAELERSEAGRGWLAELEEVKDPWFNMATGDGLYHYYGSWLDDPSIPYAALIGHVAALRAGEQIQRPTEEIERERERLADEYDGAARRGAARTVRRPARAVAHRVPVRRGAQVLLRLLVSDPLVEQGSGIWRAARAQRLPRGRRGHLPALAPRGRLGARRADADLGDRRRRRSDPSTGRRSSRGARRSSSGSPPGRRRRRSGSRPRRSPIR